MTRRHTARRAPARRSPARRRAPRRGRTGGSRSGWRTALIGIAIAVPVSLAIVLGAFVAFAVAAFSDAYDQPVADTWDAPRPPGIQAPGIAGYGLEQLANACTILAAGRDGGYDERDQTIAVMTAMGESGMRNIDYGDWETSGVTNPDGSRTTSIGLFQQQDGWGSREERLDPYTAAAKFYAAMADRVPDRAGLDPTTVAHETQVNADEHHYAPYWPRAVRVVAALAGTPAEGDRTDGIPLCP